jgi:hypothetical protein
MRNIIATSQLTNILLSFYQLNYTHGTYQLYQLDKAKLLEIIVKLENAMPT